MGGIIGRIFNEFAVVVTVAIFASAFVSLTFTPMLAAKILRKPEKDESQPRWSAWFERGFDAVLRNYDRSLKFCLRHQPMMLMVFLATLLATAWLVIATPKGFFPQEDIGQLSVSTEARQDVSYQSMVALQQQVADTFGIAPCGQRRFDRRWRSSGLNNGRLFVELKPFDQRPALQKVLADLRRDTARFRDQHLRHAGSEPAHWRRSAEPISVRYAERSIGRSSTSGRKRWRTP